mgnify:FL=1
MVYQSTATFPHLKIKPSVGQFFIRETPIIGVTVVSMWIWLFANFQGHTWFLLAVILGSLNLVYQFVYLKMTTYLVTSEQIVIVKGVFSTRVGYVELYRVVDYEERRNFAQLLFGIKTVIIHSQDRTNSCLMMEGIKDKHHLVSNIRMRVEFNKRRKAIYESTNQ